MHALSLTNDVLSGVRKGGGKINVRNRKDDGKRASV